MDVFDFVKMLIIPALLSFLLVPIVIRAAKHWNLFDYPGTRKIHKGKKPYLGGVAIFVAVNTSALLLLPVTSRLLLIIAGGAFFFVLGLLDDRYDLSPRLKLTIELAAATALVLLGIKLGLFLENPFGGFGSNSMWMWFSVPFSVLWIVGVANAVNLIDGLDALASGVVIIACAVMMAAAFLNPAVSLSPLVLILTGALIGYIKYNLYPSRIIMGDNGSLFAGYTIAIISLSSFAVPDRSIFLSIIPPAMALFVPLFDAFSAVLRRGRSGKRIFSADRNHIHHYLLEQGHSHPKAVKTLWLMSLAFGGISVLLSELIYRQIFLALVLLALILTWVIFYSIGTGFFSYSETPGSSNPSPSGEPAGKD